MKKAEVGIRDTLSALMGRNESACNLTLIDPSGRSKNVDGFQLANFSKVATSMFPAKPDDGRVRFVATACDRHLNGMDENAKAAIARQTQLASIAFCLAYENGLRRSYQWAERHVRMRVLLGRAVFRRGPRSLTDEAQLSPDEFCERVQGPDRPVELLRMCVVH